MLDVVSSAYARRASQRAAVNALPIYPTESLLWDDAQVPGGGNRYSGARPLALPKLNLQFLAPADYLLRCFALYRLEAAYEVREDVTVRCDEECWWERGERRRRSFVFMGGGGGRRDFAGANTREQDRRDLCVCCGAQPQTQQPQCGLS